MDRLSAGASVIGVIPLSIQLGTGTQALIKFLETVSDAPAEVHRFESLFDQIPTFHRTSDGENAEM